MFDLRKEAFLEIAVAMKNMVLPPQTAIYYLYSSWNLQNRLLQQDS
jgi:hypothetical protein